MEVQNFNPVWKNNIIKFNHNSNLPNSFRMLIVGSSGSGKTYLLLKMLLTPKFLDYDNLIIFSTTINQPEMVLLKTAFDDGLSKEAIIDIFNIQNLYKEKTISKIVEIYKNSVDEIGTKIKTLFSTDASKITLPNNLKPKRAKHLIIFDNVINNKNQDVMKQYFTRGRHNNCNCIYLSQNFYDLDKNNIRNNSNFFIFFKLNNRDKESIYRDIFSYSFDKEQFDKLYNDIFNEQYGYIAYNKDSDTVMDNVFTDCFAEDT